MPRTIGFADILVVSGEEDSQKAKVVKDGSVEERFGHPHHCWILSYRILGHRLPIGIRATQLRCKKRPVRLIDG